MEDRIIAVALPWSDTHRAAYFDGVDKPITPGSVQRPCHDCGQVLAVGPGTALALAADPTMDLCCPTCGVVRCQGADQVIEINVNLADPVH